MALLLLCTLGRAQTGLSDQQKTATVSGTVTSSVTGAPLAHAYVRVGRTEGQTYGAVSSEQGKFSIQAIAPGTYFLTVERRGYTPANSQPKELTLKAGDELSDLALHLVPDAVISGRVLDANGAPMEHVSVDAINSGWLHRAETDDRGQFRIGGLQPGRYLIKANLYGPLPPEIRTDGTTPINYGPTYYPDSRTAESAVPVQVRAGDEATAIEIKLISAPVLHVSGTVAPVGKARHFSIVRDGQHSGYKVGPDMRFTIWRLPPGQYQIFAISDDAGTDLRSAPAIINLTSSSIEGIHLVPSPAFELALRVEIDKSTEEARKDKDDPMVELQLVGSLQHDDPDTTRNPNGSLKITDIFPGRYRVTPGDDAQGFYVKALRLGDHEFDDGVLDLRGGPEKGPLVVQLASDGAEITGVVRDQKGPVAAAEVTLLYDDEFGFDVADTTHAQPDGSYAFHEVAPGKYKIFACDPGQAGNHWTSESLALYLPVTERIEVQEADKLTQDLKFLP